MEASGAATRSVETTEFETEQEQWESFIEVADQIVRQDPGRLSAVELLRETLTRTACNPWFETGEPFPSAAQIFDALAYWRLSPRREQLERSFQVVASP